VKKKF